MAPTATIKSLGIPCEEGPQIAVNGAASDPGGAQDTLTCAWSVLKDGTEYQSASGVDMTTLNFTPGDNGSYQITLTVSDEDGGSGRPVSETILVDNVAPRPCSI